jgi:hypothetical protein
MKSVVLALGVSLLVVRGAAAEPFTILPDGSLVFNAAVSSSGAFRCSRFISCTGSGTDTVTIHNGSDSATLTFQGVETAAEIGGHELTTVPLGRIASSASTDFIFPDLGHPSNEVLWLTLSVEQTSPVADVGRVGWGFVPRGSVLEVLRGGDYFLLGAGPNPPGHGYFFVYTVRDVPFRLPANGAVDIVADAGAVPEPATLLLITTGMAGVGWARRRSARQ